jgi:SMODS-associating 4TM effector domain
MTTTAGTAPAPHGVPAVPIHERQLDPRMVCLQRAAAASHQRGQLVESARASAAVLLAAAGIVVTLTGYGRPVMSITGAAWFLVSAFLLKRAAGATARQGALLQEMFDTALFYLPWRATVAGAPVPEPDVHHLARRLRRGSPKDQRITTGWYDSTEGVHHPYDVLIAQEQNLGWDARLRRRYASVILAAVVIWSGLGLIAGIVIANATVVNTLLSFFIPSLAAYQVALEIWAGQHRIAAERQRLLDTVTTELRNAQAGTISEPEWHRARDVARDVQDGILRTRLDAIRVPEWFYRHYRNRDELDFADTAEGHRSRLGT